jgi:hypothetical protein
MKIVAPSRVAHSYTQSLRAPADAVFPLLCPVREAEWIEGWDPDLVVTGSGAAELDCVFTTGDGADAAVWVVTRYDAALGCMVVPDGPDTCRADVTYQHTSLGPEGDRVVAEFTADAYTTFMRTWESRLNHYLATGEML